MFKIMFFRSFVSNSLIISSLFFKHTCLVRRYFGFSKNKTNKKNMRVTNFVKINNKKKTSTEKTAVSMIYENFLIMSKFLSKIQKKNFSNFFYKLRYIRARIEYIRKFNLYEKRKVKYKSFMLKNERKHGVKMQLLYRLISLNLKVKKMGLYILKVFSNKYVGFKANYFVQKFLSTYLLMYKHWYESEKWSIFDLDLSEKTRLKIMKRFWLRQSKRRVKLPLWRRAFGEEKPQDFRQLFRTGYTMRSLKVTDYLFMWHAFTRKKIQQNMWSIRSKKFFKDFFVLKSKRNKIKNFLGSGLKYLTVITNFVIFKKVNVFNAIMRDKFVFFNVKTLFTKMDINFLSSLYSDSKLIISKIQDFFILDNFLQKIGLIFFSYIKNFNNMSFCGFISYTYLRKKSFYNYGTFSLFFFDIFFNFYFILVNFKIKNIILNYLKVLFKIPQFSILVYQLKSFYSYFIEYINNVPNVILFPEFSMLENFNKNDILLYKFKHLLSFYLKN